MLFFWFFPGALGGPWGGPGGASRGTLKAPSVLPRAVFVMLWIDIHPCPPKMSDKSLDFTSPPGSTYEQTSGGTKEVVVEAAQSRGTGMASLAVSEMAALGA